MDFLIAKQTDYQSSTERFLPLSQTSPSRKLGGSDSLTPSALALHVYSFMFMHDCSKTFTSVLIHISLPSYCFGLCRSFICTLFPPLKLCFEGLLPPKRTCTKHKEAASKHFYFFGGRRITRNQRFSSSLRFRKQIHFFKTDFTSRDVRLKVKNPSASTL